MNIHLNTVTTVCLCYSTYIDIITYPVMSKLIPQRLEEVNNKKMDSLIQDLQEHLRKDGFTVESKYIDNGAKGYVTTNKEIVLHSENTNTQNFKTLLHELAHWKSEHLGERRKSNKQ